VFNLQRENAVSRLKNILASQLKNKPFILVDVGAAGSLFEPWQKIQGNSSLIAFEPDVRSFSALKSKLKSVHKVHLIDKIVSNKNGPQTLYITKNPYCSSTLSPNPKVLSKLSYSELYEVIDQRTVDAVTLERVYNSLNLNYIDWLKLDTQGTDLRIIESLPSDILDTILVIDIEPGLYGSYVGEDEFSSIDPYLRSHGFWLASLRVSKVIRMSSSLCKEVGLPSHFMKSNPKWVNARYIREVNYPIFIEKATGLDYLRLSFFAALEGWYGYSYEILDNCVKHVTDKITLKRIELAKSIILQEIKARSQKENLRKLATMPVRLYHRVLRIRSQK